MYACRGNHFPFTGMKLENNGPGLAGTSGYSAFYSERKIFDFMHDVKNLFISVEVSWIVPGFPADEFKTGNMSTVSRRANPGNGWFNPFATNPAGVRDKDCLGVKHFSINTNRGAINVKFMPTIHNGASTAGPSTQPLYWPIFEFIGVNADGATVTAAGPTTSDGSIDIAGLNNEFGEIGSNLYLAATAPGAATGFAITGVGFVTELYSHIYSNKYVASVGEEVRFTCPPYVDRFGNPKNNNGRDGFKFVQKVWFGDKEAIITGSPVFDQITVVVPVGAKTGPVRFVSKFTNGGLPDDQRSELDLSKDDYFNTTYDIEIR